MAQARTEFAPRAQKVGAKRKKLHVSFFTFKNYFVPLHPQIRKDAGVVERAALEMR
jgi:hypothetical protein